MKIFARRAVSVSFVSLLLCALAACGGGGGGSNPPLVGNDPPPPLPPPPSYIRFAFSANVQDGTISQYVAQQPDGQLTFNGYVRGLSGMAAPVDLKSHVTGKYVYVLSRDGDALGAFAVTSYGKLLGINQQPTGDSPRSVALDPLGLFAFVANYSTDDISVFRINQTTGELSAPLPPVASGDGTYALIVDPEGRHLYATNATDGTVSAFAIDRGTGALTAIASALPSGSQPKSIAISPSGRVVYVANQGSNDVAVFAVNATSGALTALGTADTNPGPFSISIEPGGHFAFTANYNSHSVNAFAIDRNTGALSALGARDLGAGVYATAIASLANGTGTRVYVTSADASTVRTFSMQPDGQLTPLASLAGRDGGYATTFTSGMSASTPSARFAYVTDVTGSALYSYGLDPVNGAPTAAPDSPIALDEAPVGSALAGPSGQYVYIASLSSIYKIVTNYATGAADPAYLKFPFSSISSMAMDPGGFFIYAGDTHDHLIRTLGISAIVGNLTDTGESVPTAGFTSAVVVHPAGRFVYVLDSGADQILGFTADSAGALTPVAGSPYDAGNHPVAATIDGTGRFLYVSDSAADTVQAYGIDLVSGALSAVGDAVTIGGHCLGLSTDPLGHQLYVTRTNANGTASTYDIDDTTGALKLRPSLSAGHSRQDLVVDPRGHYALTTEADTGNLSVIPISPDGMLESLSANVTSISAGALPYKIVITKQ